MKIIERRLGEALVLVLPDGRLVTLTVTAIRGGSCKLGIIAPRDVPAMRGELVPRAREGGR